MPIIMPFMCPSIFFTAIAPSPASGEISDRLAPAGLQLSSIGRTSGRPLPIPLDVERSPAWSPPYGTWGISSDFQPNFRFLHDFHNRQHQPRTQAPSLLLI